MEIKIINPATEEIINTFEEHTSQEIEARIEKTHFAYRKWKDISFSKKSELWVNIANLLRANKNKYAKLMALEMGKPFSQGISEVEKCAWVCEYYSENAEKQLKCETIRTEMSQSYIYYQPIGIVLAIMPWNFPFWQVFRFAAPTLMAGNTAILKHSPNTAGCSIAIEKIFLKAGFPENVFTNILVHQNNVPNVIQKVIENQYISAVTLTGSARAGASVAKIAGSVIKKSVLELGGSDPYIVLEDADLENSVSACLTGRIINSGQSCIAAKRMIVHKNIKDDFISILKEKMLSLKIGNTLESQVDVGPIARNDLRTYLHWQVQDSIKKGANAELGCEIPDGKGFFYPLSILSNVKKGMPAFNEEIFGPVASVIIFDNIDEAIELANDHKYGLGGAVFSMDIEKAVDIAKKLEVGSVQINDFVRSDPRLPFGGIKNSGYGRELSALGIKEFVNAKTICVK